MTHLIKSPVSISHKSPHFFPLSKDGIEKIFQEDHNLPDRLKFFWIQADTFVSLRDREQQAQIKIGLIQKIALFRLQFYNEVLNESKIPYPFQSLSSEETIKTIFQNHIPFFAQVVAVVKEHRYVKNNKFEEDKQNRIKMLVDSTLKFYNEIHSKLYELKRELDSLGPITHVCPRNWAIRKFGTLKILRPRESEISGKSPTEVFQIVDTKKMEIFAYDKIRLLSVVCLNVAKALEELYLMNRSQ